jgi:hypothetical protein
VDPVVEVDDLGLAVFEDHFGEADLGRSSIDLQHETRAAVVDVHRHVGPTVFTVESSLAVQARTLGGGSVARATAVKATAPR